METSAREREVRTKEGRKGGRQEREREGGREG